MEKYTRHDCDLILDGFDNETFSSLPLHEKRRLFYALHYQPDEEGHIGAMFAVVRHRVIKDGKRGRRTRDILASYDPVFLAGFEQKSGQDVYITASSFKNRDSRRRGDLLAMNNIVIDIDAHKAPMKYMDESMDKLETGLMYGLFYDDILPMPNTIVRTGRGLQLWWNIEQLPAGLLWMWKKVAGAFCDEIDGFLKDNADKFPGTELDRAASCNPSGLFRMPGSYNMAAKKAGSFEILHIDQFDVAWHYDRHMGRDRGEKPHNSGPAAGSRLLADRRAKKLEKLLELRGRDVTGQRDLFCFCLACIYGRVLRGEELYKKIQALNASFTEPLPERELRACMSSVLSREHAISNPVLIEKLSISKEEQELTGIGISKRVLAKKKKAERDQKIADLTRQGRPNTAIAAIVGCARSTVTAVQKRLGILRAGIMKREEAKKAIREGMTARAVSERSGLSLSSVYAMLKKVIKRMPGKAPFFIAESPVFALNKESYADSHISALFPCGPAPAAPFGMPGCGPPGS